MISKLIKYTVMSVAAVSFYSCHSSFDDHSRAKEINIPQYFKQEIQKLEKLNPQVSKTVNNNDQKENRIVENVNWEKELAQFTTIDLNKNNFDSMTKDSVNKVVTYSLSNKNKDTLIVKVIYGEDEIQALDIKKRVNYILFSNDERLYYESGKKYLLQKSQHILGLGERKYYIEGNIQ